MITLLIIDAISLEKFSYTKLLKEFDYGLLDGSLFQEVAEELFYRKENREDFTDALYDAADWLDTLPSAEQALSDEAFEVGIALL